MSRAAQDSGLVLTVEKGDADEQSDMGIARQIAAALNRHYPGHPWTVHVQGRGIILRHTLISAVAGAFLRKEGFSYLMPRHRMGTAKEIEQSAINAGGSMLELFSLPRAADTGLLPLVPKHWKRKQQKDFA